MTTDADSAWFAGLFEGEGTVHCRQGKQITLTIAMQDEDVIRQAADVWPEFGNVTTWTQAPKNGRTYKPLWVYRIGDRTQLVSVIQSIWPWLCSRRREQLTEKWDSLDAVREGRLDNLAKLMSSYH